MEITKNWLLKEKKRLEKRMKECVFSEEWISLNGSLLTVKKMLEMIK